MFAFTPSHHIISDEIQYEVINKENFKILNKIIEKKEIFSHVNTDGNTFFHLAVNNLNVMKYLVERLSLQEKEILLKKTFNHHGQTPLHLAVENLNKEAINYLLDFGYDINVANKKGQSPLFNLINKIARLNNAFNLDRDLHASLTTLFNFLQWLLDEKKPNIFLEDNRGLQIIHYAILHNAPELLTFLHKNGFTKELINPQQNRLLSLAVRNPQAQNIIQYLVENYSVDVNEVDENGMTALHHAAFFKQPENIKLLLDYGAKITTDKLGRTLLHFALEKNDEFSLEKHAAATVEFLLTHTKIDINSENNEQQTVTELAVGEGYVDLTEYLLDQPGNNSEAEVMRNDVAMIAKENLEDRLNNSLRASKRQCVTTLLPSSPSQSSAFASTPANSALLSFSIYPSTQNNVEVDQEAMSQFYIKKF